MEWRQLQTRLEEAKLEELHARAAQIVAEMRVLEKERNQAGRGLVASGTATGLELAFLDAFQSAADAELARQEASLASCRREIEQQTMVVSERRRDVRLLEKLKDQKQRAWRMDFNRELEHQAAESYLARWGAVRQAS